MYTYSSLEEQEAERVAEAAKELEQVKEHNAHLLTQLSNLKVHVHACTLYWYVQYMCTYTHVHVQMYIHVYTCTLCKNNAHT